MLAYKVVEESLSPSGKIGYKTLPLYKQIPEDDINGKHEFVQNNEHPISSFGSYEDAEKWMKNFFVGYTYVRPVIFLVDMTDVIGTKEKTINTHDGLCSITINESSSVRFIKPEKYMVGNKIYEYSPMVKPEKKKSSHGFSYDESEITGDVDYCE